MLVGILIIGGLVGGIIAISHFWRRHQEKKAASWASTPGQIVTSQVWESFEQGTDGMERVYRPNVVYTYVVDGQTLKGERVDFDNHDYSIASRAQPICDKYPVGANVTVYYDPAKPSHAVLDRGKA